jgi:hypothetical protein
MDHHEVARPLAIHLDDSIGQGCDQCLLVADEARLGQARRQVRHNLILPLPSKRF